MGPTRLAELLSPWSGAGPAYSTLAAGVRGLALDGRLPVGERLPSERALAAALELSRTTVTAAYDVLRAEGYLRSDRGAGSRLALPTSAPVRPDASAADREVGLDLTVAALPAPHQLLDAVQQASVALRPLLSGHGLHPLGLPELRAAIALHLSRGGLATSADQILVTAGALHGWDLVLRAFGRRGTTVLVEQPTYPAVLDAVADHGLRVRALPVSAAGWELPAGGPPAGLAHVTPDGQNPTGLLAGPAARRALLSALEGTLVVADETFRDLVLDGPLPPPLASYDRRVLTVGSMSKAFWAGLRIGWLRGPPDTVARLAQARGGQDLAGPVLEQLVAARLLGAAEEILPARRAMLRRRRDRLASVLAAELPDWRFTLPAAGLVLWVELPGSSSTRLCAHALQQGLRLTPGPRFTVDGTADRWLRLPFTLPAGEVEDVVRILRSAATATSAGAPDGPARASRWTA